MPSHPSRKSRKGKRGSKRGSSSRKSSSRKMSSRKTYRRSTRRTRRRKSQRGGAEKTGQQIKNELTRLTDTDIDSLTTDIKDNIEREIDGRDLTNSYTKTAFEDLLKTVQGLTDEGGDSTQLNALGNNIANSIFPDADDAAAAADQAPVIPGADDPAAAAVTPTDAAAAAGNSGTIMEVSTNGKTYNVTVTEKQKSS